MYRRETRDDQSFGEPILPKTRPPVKLKVLAFGNGGAWPVIP
jgi:hypothetical protein